MIGGWIMKKIKEYRLRANLSQGQLAEKLNVKQPSVSQWERGAAYPEIDTARRISDILNMPFGLIFDHYSVDEPIDIPVYSVVRGKDVFIECTKPGCILKVTEEELRMLIPRSEASDRGLTRDQGAKIDPNWFIGYYCESENLAPAILPNTVNLIYRTGKIINNAVHLASLNGHDAVLVKLIRNERGILVIEKTPTEKYRYFRFQDMRNGSLKIYGIVVESIKVFKY